jgi:4-amino-4-deoxy-L-arabinose transferase-like glycosyltransferase
MRWWTIITLFAIIAVPWFVLVAMHNPEFNHYFWYDQHIARFLGRTTGNDHNHGVMYYVKFLPLIFFPWSFFAPAALLAGWRHRNGTSAGRRGLIFLLCGTCWIFLFFSASSGKIVTYILPMIPLLAVMMAGYFNWLYECQKRTRRVAGSRLLTTGVIFLALLLVTGGASVLVLAPQKLQQLGVFASAAIAPGVILIVWGIAIFITWWRLGIRGLIASTSAGFVAMFASALILVITVAPQFTTESLVAYIRPGLTARARVVTIAYPQSVVFYTGKRLDVIDPPDEITLGVRQLPPSERKRWIYDGSREIAELQRDLDYPGPVYCFVRYTSFEKELKEIFANLDGEVVMIVANERYLVFGNQTAAALTPPVIDESLNELLSEDTRNESSR